MGTIAQKLEYLNTTKSKLKDSINALGGEIDNDTTFREYAEELDTIYSNLPKVTGEGNNISLSPTLKGKLELEYKGDIYQETLTGKNLFNPVIKIDNTNIIQHLATITTDLETNEMTFTSSIDGEIWIGNVVASGSSYNYSVGWLMEVEPNTSYTFQSINNVINRVVWTEFDENKISLGYRDLGATIITKSNTKYLLARIGKQQTTSGTTYKDKIQIRKTSTSSDFELYCGGIPSPNPNYPQDIQVVTGTQTLTISNEDNTESQTYTLHLGDEELAKIGSYQDYIYYNNGKWYKYGAIKKLTGTELITLGTFQNSTSYSDTTYLCCYNNAMRSIDYANTILYCNYFQGTYHYTNQKVANNMRISSSSLGICVLKSDFATASDLNNWWTTNGSNILIYAVLLTGTSTEITDTTLLQDLNNIKENAMSYSGTTNISSSGDLPIVISASALKGE